MVDTQGMSERLHVQLSVEDVAYNVGIWRFSGHESALIIF